MTNYERIKNMSVEEMAEFLNEASNCCLVPTDCITESCTECLKQWLESEVTE